MIAALDLCAFRNSASYAVSRVRRVCGAYEGSADTRRFSRDAVMWRVVAERGNAKYWHTIDFFPRHYLVHIFDCYWFEEVCITETFHRMHMGPEKVKSVCEYVL